MRFQRHPLCVTLRARQVDDETAPSDTSRHRESLPPVVFVSAGSGFDPRAAHPLICGFSLAYASVRSGGSYRTASIDGPSPPHSAVTRAIYWGDAFSLVSLTGGAPRPQKSAYTYRFGMRFSG